jgi:hypothetical protein
VTQHLSYAVRTVWPLPNWLYCILRWTYRVRGIHRTQRIFWAVIADHQGPWLLIDPREKLEMCPNHPGYLHSHDLDTTHPLEDE